MEAIRIVQKPVNGIISFPVPDDMRDDAIIIEFKPDRPDLRVEVIRSRKGRATHSTYPTDKYDVYNQ